MLLNVGCSRIALVHVCKIPDNSFFFWLLNADIRVGLKYAEHEFDRKNYDYYDNECSDYAPYHIMQYT